MRTLLGNVIAILCFSSLNHSDLHGQIRDDESSTSYLAMQCAMSSGGDARDYEEYGRRLAKTVALLSPGQQERVFGFVPQPITFSRPADAGQRSPSAGSAAGQAQEEFNPGGDEFASISAPAVEESPPVAAALSQEELTIGNSPDPDLGAETEDVSETSGESETDWWAEVFGWLGGIFDSVVEGIAEHQQSNR